MTEGQIIEALEKASDLFIQNTMLRDAGRAVKWSIVKGLSSAMGWCQKLYTVSLGAVDFTNYSKLDSWISSLKLVFMGIMILALFYLGITFIIGTEKKPKILQSLCLSGLCISGLAYLLTVFSPLTADLAKTIAGNQTLKNRVVLENLYDLQYIDQNWGLDSLDGDNLSEYVYSGVNLNIKLINFNEVINPEETEGLSDNGKEILSKYILYLVDETGVVNKHAADIYTGMKAFSDSQGNGFLNSFYYRYEMNFLPIFLTCLAYILVYVLLAYKVIRIIFEIALYRVLALLYSADLNGAQKTMKILAGIRDSYIVLLFTAVEVKVFGFADEFLSDMANGQTGIYSFLLLFVAIAVIDGPNLIQQITGIDAGLNGLLGKALAAGQMAAMTASFSTRMIFGMLRSVKRGVEKAGKGTAKMASDAAEKRSDPRSGRKENPYIYSMAEKMGENADPDTGRPGDRANGKESLDMGNGKHDSREKDGLNGKFPYKAHDEGKGSGDIQKTDQEGLQRMGDNLKDTGLQGNNKEQPVNMQKSGVEDDFKTMDQDLADRRKTGDLTGSSGSGIDRQISYSSSRAGSLYSKNVGREGSVGNNNPESREKGKGIEKEIDTERHRSLESPGADKINRKSILSDGKKV